MGSFFELINTTFLKHLFYVILHDLNGPFEKNEVDLTFICARLVCLNRRRPPGLFFCALRHIFKYERIIAGHHDIKGGSRTVFLYKRGGGVIEKKMNESSLQEKMLRV